MKKENLKKIFGSYSNAAKAVGYSRSRITLLPEFLPERYVDLFRGASIRLGVYRPDLFPTLPAPEK